MCSRRDAESTVLGLGVYGFELSCVYAIDLEMGFFVYIAFLYLCLVWEMCMVSVPLERE